MTNDWFAKYLEQFDKACDLAADKDGILIWLDSISEIFNKPYDDKFKLECIKKRLEIILNTYYKKN